MNRTGYRPGVSVGLRSWIEPELAVRLSRLLQTVGARIVLSSDWRGGREMAQLAEELRAGGVEGELLDKTPVLGHGRWREIAAWMTENGVAAEQVVIVDDGYDMGPLAARFVRCSPLRGLDEEAARAVEALFDQRSEVPQPS